MTKIEILFSNEILKSGNAPVHCNLVFKKKLYPVVLPYPLYYHTVGIFCPVPFVHFLFTWKLQEPFPFRHVSSAKHHSIMPKFFSNFVKYTFLSINSLHFLRLPTSLRPLAERAPSPAPAPPFTSAPPTPPPHIPPVPTHRHGARKSHRPRPVVLR